MPTLTRLVVLLLVIGAIAAAALYGLAYHVDPPSRERTVRIEREGFAR